MARSTSVAHTLECGKLLKYHLKGKTCRKWADGLKIYDSEKKRPQVLFCSHPGAIYMLVGEPKLRILQNDKKIAPDFDMAEFLYIGSLNSA